MIKVNLFNKEELKAAISRLNILKTKSKGRNRNIINERLLTYNTFLKELYI